MEKIRALKRSFDLLSLYEQEYNDQETVLGGKSAGDWYTYSAEEFVKNCNLVSLGFLSLGVKKGDVVATITNNRPEWNFVDMGLAQIGAVHLPIYPTIGTDEYKYIFEHSKAKFVLVGDKKIYGKIHDFGETVKSIEEIFSFDEVEGIRNWIDISKLGDEYNRKSELQSLKEEIQEDDLATLIYTSGTTGDPKGVMLSHRNLVSNFTQHCYNHTLEKGATAVSFLPLCHIYERTMNYHYLYKGINVYYIGSLSAIIGALKEIKPNVFCTVPRLLERIYDGIISKGKELKGIKKAIFFWAVRLGDHFEYNKKFSLWFNFKRSIADKLIYSKWREVMGGEVDVIISGGAALQPRVSKVFGIANICALEGYGLTETSPVIAVSNKTKGEIKIGTVGPILPGIEVKIADDGEILCKGPNVMLGYYKSPDVTKEAIDEDGYFHTGDVGKIVDGKYLKITDRKKEIFKLSNGKYIAPQVIENKMKESFFIDQAMVIGADQKFASALVVPNFQYIERWADEQGIKVANKEEAIKNKKVIEAIMKEVHRVNRTMGSHEQIKRYRLLATEWTPDTGDLSPTLKLKRKKITAQYENVINEIFMEQ